MGHEKADSGQCLICESSLLTPMLQGPIAYYIFIVLFI